MDAATLIQQLPFTLTDTDFPMLGKKYRGKVRDTYRQDDRLVLITTDRLSAFDHILTTLPFKGDLLNQLAHFWFQKTAHVVKNHVLDVPDPCVMVARRADPFAIEFVVRAHLTGSLWREYETGKDPYALRLPPGMKKDQAFDQPLLTPSTKAPLGSHDEPLCETQVVQRGLASPRDWQRMAEAALALFSAGQAQAKARGLILVDTKYEFGLIKDELILIDEIHTPDSSRYWLAEGWERRFQNGQPQVMLDKENLRQWLVTERGFTGQGAPPEIPNQVRISLTQTYVSAYERITGQTFVAEPADVHARIEANLTRVKLI